MAPDLALNDLPLTGVKIADFSWVGAGPRATKDLADLGATVIKIESRKRLDLGRLSPPFAHDKPDPDGSAFFAITNTSKLGVTIDLSRPEGIALAKRLVAWSDVVVENFGPGFMDRIGLGHDVLAALRPGLIQVSVSVAGRTGPMGKLRGYGNSAAALSGLAAMSGWADRDPHMPPFAYGDVIAPMFASVAVLSALEHRRLTGEGQHIDISQVEPLVHVLSDEYARFQSGEEVRNGNRGHGMAPCGIFPARGHDQWVCITVRSDGEWSALAALSGIDDPAYALTAGREAGADALEAALGTWTRGHNKHELADLLAAHGIPAEAVADGRDVFTDPELLDSGHFAEVDHPVLGRCDMPAIPMRFSGATTRCGPSPLLGQDNAHVFTDILGISPDELAALAADGVLG